MMLLFFVCLFHLTHQCHDNWYNQCQQNSACCSGYCFLGEDGEWQYGICKPNEESGGNDANLDGPCKPDWYNKCQGHNQCCSQWCYRGESDDWAEGTCKPK